MAVLTPRDELGYHGIVERRYGVMGVNTAVHPNSHSAWRSVILELAGRGSKVVQRVFGVDAAFDGPALYPHFFLLDAEGKS